MYCDKIIRELTQSDLKTHTSEIKPGKIRKREENVNISSNNCEGLKNSNIITRKCENDSPEKNMTFLIEKSERKQTYVPTKKIQNGTTNVNTDTNMGMQTSTKNDTIEQCFSKVYEFNNSSRKRIQKTKNFFTEEKWKIAHLMTLKKQLNLVKSKLNDLNLSDWHKHTRQLNSAAFVSNHLKHNIGPELLTQAWCKFQEIVSSTPLVPKQSVDDGQLNSVHLCEAPGAFVTSLNHYLKTKRPFIVWDWMATTLNPYHEQNENSEMINDDRLIFNTLNKWNFGIDLTGDIFNPMNLQNIVETVEKKWDKVSLVTADGSFDCQDNPGEQESMVAPLLYCEVITALRILKPGGSFLIKMFTIFECETVCLLYLLFQLFDVVKVFKPATSKEGNSEVYVICLCYNPVSSITELLLSKYGPNITKYALFRKEDIPKQFIKQIVECARYFEGLQENVINRNITYFFKKMNYMEIADLKRRQNEIANHYIKCYQIERLPYGQIVGNHYLKVMPLYNMDARGDSGTFRERISLNESNQCVTMKLDQLKKTIERVSECSRIFTKETVWLEFQEFALDDVDIKIGKPVINVNTSKFCSGVLLKAFNKLTQLLGSINWSTNSASAAMHPAIEICDVSNQPWFINQWLAQRLASKVIIDSLLKMEDKSSFILTGLPLVTQFNVGLVYVIGFAFDKVGFADPLKSGYSLLFQGLCKQSLDLVNKKFFNDLKNKINNSDSAVLSLVPIHLLCENYLYRVVVATNHIYLKSIISSKVEDTSKGMSDL